MADLALAYLQKMGYLIAIYSNFTLNDYLRILILIHGLQSAIFYTVKSQ